MEKKLKMFLETGAIVWIKIKEKCFDLPKKKRQRNQVHGVEERVFSTIVELRHRLILLQM